MNSFSQLPETYILPRNSIRIQIFNLLLNILQLKHVIEIRCLIPSTKYKENKSVREYHDTVMCDFHLKLQTFFFFAVIAIY
jgi:hypothetical protein